MKPSGYFDVYEGKDGTPSFIQIKPELADKTSVKLYSADDIKAWLLKAPESFNEYHKELYFVLIAAKLEELK